MLVKGAPSLVIHLKKWYTYQGSCVYSCGLANADTVIKTENEPKTLMRCPLLAFQVHWYTGKNVIINRLSPIMNLNTSSWEIHI